MFEKLKYPTSAPIHQLAERRDRKGAIRARLNAGRKNVSDGFVLDFALSQRAAKNQTAPIRLTALSSCAGCAAKLNQKLLAEIVTGLESNSDPRLLVGSATGDDAGVYKLDRNRALILTTDFFTPIVDDPYHFGQIAATNALSDVYAMGGRPLTALNVMGIPTLHVPPDAIRAILRGGYDKAREAKCAIVGGHTIRIPEPVYGLAVTGIVHPRNLLTNARGRPGDILVLTKPLGTGIATTGIKRDLASGALVASVTRLMETLNSVGAGLAEARLIQSATDVTGFGLLGHLATLCKASEVSATLLAESLPVISPEIFALIARDCIPGGSAANAQIAAPLTRFHRAVSRAHRTLITDAQTSGGLLLCVPPKKWDAVRKLLKRHHTLAAAVVGRLEKPQRPLISVNP